MKECGRKYIFTFKSVNRKNVLFSYIFVNSYVVIQVPHVDHLSPVCL